MTILFHPSQPRLSAFARGELEFGPSLLVAVHVEGCPRCRRAIEVIEDEQGGLLETLPDSEVDPRVFNNILAAIEAPDKAADPHASVVVEGCQLPSAIERIGLMAPIHLTPEAWIAHLDAPRHGQWRTYLFCAPAGTALPEHGHSGEELIAVLDGAFTDGRHFGPGDFAENGTDFAHWMRVTPSGRCVALISSAGPITWKAEDRHIGRALDI